MEKARACGLVAGRTWLFAPPDLAPRLLLAKHFGLEGEDTRGLLLPEVRRKPSLLAGVREEFLRAPRPLDGDLGEEEPALPPTADDEAVAADLHGSEDRFRASGIHPHGRREQGDLDHDVWELLHGERREAAVLQGGRDRR